MSIISESDPTRISCIGDLIAHVCELLSSDNRIRWFRGHSDASWEVLPSIWRQHEAEAERDLTNRFRSRAGIRMSRQVAANDYATWLSIMQHYRLPTRLLDWTRSPLVAAHFAVEKFRSERQQSTDAAVWVLNPHVLNSVEIAMDLTPPIDSATATEMLVPAFTTSSAESDKVAAVMAVEHDLRMFVQQGAFTIHSRRQPLNKQQGHSRYLSPILIAASDVPRISSELLACGLTQGDVFPDLENLAHDLRKRWWP